MAGGPAPGWYPDPSGSGQRRYWDGTAWTGHVVAGAPPPAAAAPAESGRSGFWKFWSTLPGVLTGLAALVGAVAGMLVLFRGDGGTSTPTTPTVTTSAPGTVPPPVTPAEVDELNLPALDAVTFEQQALIGSCAAGDLVACTQIQEILAEECRQGLGISCDVLFQFSAPGSQFELYGATCGFRVDASFAGQCQRL